MSTESPQKHYLLMPVGSHGDVHPYMGIGKELQNRGHSVTMATNEHFGSLAQNAGFEFRSTYEEKAYQDALQDPDLWHPTKGMKAVFSLTTQLIKPSLDVIEDIYRQHKQAGAESSLTILSSNIGFAARIAREKWQIPLITIQLQPTCFISLDETCVYANTPWLHKMPRPIKAMIFKLGILYMDRLLAPAIHPVQRELGLRPARKIMDAWWHSPDLNIGLFPEWFARPQRDWPDKVKLTTFPLYDESEKEIPEDASYKPYLDKLKAAGSRPLVFTPGSANRHGKPFFEMAARLCQKLDRPGLLLSRYAEHIPGDLPASIHYEPFIPFSHILPYASLLVHHGGIGTCAQALSNGVPQLITPLSHDQPDNAHRLKRMGVGDWIKPPSENRQPSEDELLSKVKHLLSSDTVKKQCDHYAQTLKKTPPLHKTCDLIENLMPAG